MNYCLCVCCWSGVFWAGWYSGVMSFPVGINKGRLSIYLSWTNSKEPLGISHLMSPIAAPAAVPFVALNWNQNGVVLAGPSISNEWFIQMKPLSYFSLSYIRSAGRLSSPARPERPEEYEREQLWSSPSALLHLNKRLYAETLPASSGRIIIAVNLVPLRLSQGDLHKHLISSEQTLMNVSVRDWDIKYLLEVNISIIYQHIDMFTVLWWWGMVTWHAGKLIKY